MSVKDVYKTISVILLVLFSAGSAQAVVPPTLNYQGHLTDSAGVPIDGPVNMTFAIYDVETGGIARWSESQAVTVDQGVFSVRLGSIVPFPNGLESPLWFALTVGTDAEMTPRRPFDTVAFAFNASNADALEGVSAASLDQSAHVIDMANPHAVSPAQIGAADVAALSAHTTDTSNPHSVTAVQAGAATSTDFTTHIGNSSAHHTRYSNSEAVSAMGTKSDGNPLHHDKYTDSNVVTAMLANDGAGSTLDSDKVDGLEASELIDAAQDEVRTPISTLPYTISQSGSYYLTGNLDGSSGGIDITADDVALDLMGFTIDGGGTVNDYGIYFTNRSNIVVRNGTVKRFGLAGIYQASTTALFASVIDIQALNNGTLGTGGAGYAGIFISSRNSHIERCIAGNNGGYGIWAFISSKLIYNTAYNNGGTYGIYGDTGASLAGNTAYGNGGTGIWGSTNSSLINNTAYSNSGGYGIYGGSGASLSGNTSYNNTGLYGISGGAGASLTGNIAYNNSGLYGIYGATGASLIGNTAYSNTNWGMYAVSANLVKDNTLYANNDSNTIGQGGLRISTDSRVVGNTLDHNSQNNLYITSSDNVIKDNHVTDSINGIFFNLSGNYYKDNTGAGNTTFINLNGTTQTDGGGNVSF